MTEDMTPDNAPAEPHDLSPVSGLNTWERFIAGVVGLVAAGAGGVSVFLSDNQAGSTTLLLCGAVFLLLAVQGTAIRKATKDSVELERRRIVRRVVVEAREVLNDEGADEARAFIAGATARDPAILSNPGIRRFTFEIDLYVAISLIGYQQFGDRLIVTRNAIYNGREFDAIITFSARGVILVDATYTFGSAVAAEKLTRKLSRMRRFGKPSLIVSNAPRPDIAFTELREGDPPVEFVVWRSAADNKELEAALRKLEAFYA